MRLLTLLLLCASAGAQETSKPVEEPPKTGSISGTVTENGGGLAGVSGIGAKFKRSGFVLRGEVRHGGTEGAEKSV